MAVVVGRIVDQDFHGAEFALDAREDRADRFQVGQLQRDSVVAGAGRRPGCVPAPPTSSSWMSRKTTCAPWLAKASTRAAPMPVPPPRPPRVCPPKGSEGQLARRNTTGFSCCCHSGPSSLAAMCRAAPGCGTGRGHRRSRAAAGRCAAHG